MKVRAKDMGEDQIYSGFYANQRRRPGDIFDLENPSDFRPSWMEKMDFDNSEVAESPPHREAMDLI